MDYIPRLADAILAKKLELFGAVEITGPKFCGKTTTARHQARSEIDLQDPDQWKRYSEIAERKPSLLLDGDTPRLIDEWQEIPELWDSVRYTVDRRDLRGQFIMTGSVNSAEGTVKHSGTGRISGMKMRTMTLAESGISTCQVGLSELFRNPKTVEGSCGLGYSEYAEIIICGGWPDTHGMPYSDIRMKVKDYCESLMTTKTQDGIGRNPEKLRALLKSLSRNIGTAVSIETLRKDMNGHGQQISENTVQEYLAYLKRIHISDDTPAWNPKLRSKTAIRSKPVRYLTDPAIGAYFLGAGKNDLEMDPETYGFLFENLVMRDMKAYADTIGAEVYHYHDQNGLETDCIIHRDDGKWGAVEIKLGTKHVPEAIRSLHSLRNKVEAGTEGEPQFLAVVTGTEFAYTEDDVHVVPLGCLGPGRGIWPPKGNRSDGVEKVTVPSAGS